MVRFFAEPFRKNALSLHLNSLKQRMKQKSELLRTIIEGVLEKKGKNITVIHLGEMPGAICDHFVICEGNTPTQVSALAESVEEMVKKSTGESPVRVQGRQRSEWIGVDYGNVIVHIFLPELRVFYNLDHLWEDARSERILSPE